MSGMAGQLDPGTKIDGGTDLTSIGNIADSLKVAVTQSTLPAGASTSALQTTINTSINTLSAKFNSLGQKTMANSAPVVLASDQSAIPVTQSGGWTVGRTWTLGSGTDSVSAVQSGTWTVRNQDGTGNALVVTNTELTTRDICNSGGTQGAITVGTSAILASSNGASNFTNRKSLSVYNNGTVFIYYGHTNAVTISSGIPLAPGSIAIFAIGAVTNVYLISGTAAQNVRISEIA